jgi:hypothetical protein
VLGLDRHGYLPCLLRRVLACPLRTWMATNGFGGQLYEALRVQHHRPPTVRRGMRRPRPQTSSPTTPLPLTRRPARTWRQLACTELCIRRLQRRIRCTHLQPLGPSWKRPARSCTETYIAQTHTHRQLGVSHLSWAAPLLLHHREAEGPRLAACLCASPYPAREPSFELGAASLVKPAPPLRTARRRSLVVSRLRRVCASGMAGFENADGQWQAAP